MSIIFKRFRWGATAVLAAWEAGVAYRRSRPPVEETFRVGTTDDLLMDNLKAGDLIFFSHHWTTEHVPFMILHSLYKRCLETDVDHCGLLVQDKLGHLFVYEHTYTGKRVRPFPSRIQWSKSRMILVRTRTEELSSNEKSLLWSHATSSVRSSYSYYFQQIWSLLCPNETDTCEDTTLVNTAMAVATKGDPSYLNTRQLLEDPIDNYTESAIPIRTS